MKASVAEVGAKEDGPRNSGVIGFGYLFQVTHMLTGGNGGRLRASNIFIYACGCFEGSW